MFCQNVCMNNQLGKGSIKKSPVEARNKKMKTKTQADSFSTGRQQTRRNHSLLMTLVC